MIAKIAVSSAVFAIDKPYSYAIPRHLTLVPGLRVMVPFGRGNRKAEGIVLSVEEGNEEGLKQVDKCLDETPLLSPTMLRLAAFMCQRYFCTFYDAVKAMLPSGLWFSVQDTYTLTKDADVALAECTRNTNATALLNALISLGGSASYTDLRKLDLSEDDLQDALRHLLKKDILSSQTDFLRRAEDKTEYVITLDCGPAEAEEYIRRKAKSAPMQAEVLRLLISVGSACAKEVQYFTGATMQTLRRLEELGFVALSQREVLRKVEREEVTLSTELTLTPAQESVFSSLSTQMDKDDKKPALLYGVTGSGKTSVYIKLISQCLSQGKSAILLVPEIALTPQLLGLMGAHFGKEVAVLHSSLRMGERYDEHKRIRTGKARVVVGTRSAVFAPAENLGLIIVDEEQEHTYKSENSPRYHAREIAIWRGSRENALVVLGSATPSVESMYHAKKGDYILETLSERYNGKDLPQVELADMRAELKNGNSGILSTALLGRLQQCVEDGRQAILFLNRRGNSRFVVCVDCGEVPQCPRCSVSLTYHSANGRLMCHYCGHSQILEQTCPSCGGHLKPVGAGTQKVEEELHEKLPQASVLRMDADTVSATNSHGTILKKFKDEKISILLGTQMVAKGLDFENVTLVGVLDADQSLYVQNFRGAETTFSMVTQVVGRAGRGEKEGRAVIQTLTPEHPVILSAAQQDYDAFFSKEISLRQSLQLPPFSEMITIHFSGESQEVVPYGAMLFRKWLEKSLQYPDYENLQVQILGPAPAPVMKVNGCYYYRLTLCTQNGQKLRPLLAHLMREFAKNAKLRAVRVYADCNPYE
ncbi:MAG: primosomal protein N' [Oscillospiraceae bacterium]|nr:primosomal protein N' [Oscillospiraceae bacterium]